MANLETNTQATADTNGNGALAHVGVAVIKKSAVTFAAELTPVSVTQIAARAGVSIATASRVMNNNRRVSPELVEQVRKAMTELRYSQQDARRRRNRATRHKTIAIVSLGGPRRVKYD